jgi:hypothetical protein
VPYCGVGVGVSGGVGVGGLGDAQPGLVGVGVRGHAEGVADLLPAVPGFACLADVVAGGVPGAELDVPRGAGAGERLQVADGHARTVVRLPGDEPGAAITGQADDRAAGVIADGSELFRPLVGAAGWIRHRSVLLHRGALVTASAHRVCVRVSDRGRGRVAPRWCRARAGASAAQ